MKLTQIWNKETMPSNGDRGLKLVLKYLTLILIARVPVYKVFMCLELPVVWNYQVRPWKDVNCLIKSWFLWFWIGESNVIGLKQTLWKFPHIQNPPACTLSCRKKISKSWRKIGRTRPPPLMWQGLFFKVGQHSNHLYFKLVSSMKVWICYDYLDFYCPSSLEWYALFPPFLFSKQPCEVGQTITHRLHG